MCGDVGRAQGLRWAGNVCAMWGNGYVGDGGDGGEDKGFLLVGGGREGVNGSMWDEDGRVSGVVGKRRVRGRAGDVSSKYSSSLEEASLGKGSV